MLRLGALVLSAWGLLSGCTAPSYSYSKAGADLAAFRQDSYSCVQEPRVSLGTTANPIVLGASVDARREAKLYRMCMKAKGWTAEAPQ